MRFGQAGDVEADGREAFSEALIVSARYRFREFPTVPASISRQSVTWERGPGLGWRLRRQVRRVRRALESQGFVVTTCVTGRRYRLVREGLLPHRHQDRLGMAAVLVAERPSANDGDLASVH